MLKIGFECLGVCVKKILFFCFFFSLLGTSCINAHGIHVNNVNHLARGFVIEKALVSTVGLYSFEKKTINCTGFFIAPNLVATAKHCIIDDEFSLLANMQDADKLIEKTYFGRKVLGVKYQEHLKDQAKNSNLKTFQMEILYMTSKFNSDPLKASDDIAILKVVNKKNWSKNWFKIANKDPSVGQKVYTVGMPLGNDWTVFEGNIAKHIFYSNAKTVRVYYTNIYVAPGSSGGPLFNHHGRVVGVTSSAFFTNVSRQSELSISMAKHRLSQHVEIAKKILKKKQL
jgi:V8-like Glu-specific endopeptidase